MFTAYFKKYQKKSRENKYRLFMRLMRPEKGMVILDVGSGPGTFLEDMYPHKEDVIALDVSDQYLSELKKKYPQVKTVKTSALKLPFKDNSIDIVFSNAVIEHVGDLENQKQFASEISRVAKKYFVTTPNRHFPFEPHYRMPFYQFVPKNAQKYLGNRFSIGNYKRGEWEDINLVSASTLRKLFPGAKLIKNKVFFFSETLIVSKC